MTTVTNLKFVGGGYDFGMRVSDELLFGESRQCAGRSINQDEPVFGSFHHADGNGSVLQDKTGEVALALGFRAGGLFT